MFSNPPRGEIDRLLKGARTIAVIGLSADPARPSHSVARALKDFGYRVIPVNPRVRAVLGEPAAADLAEAAGRVPSGKIDIVDVFRRPEHVAAIVTDCIRLRLPALWLQQGVIDAASAERAREAGILTVMDRCIYRDRAALQ
jgi:predicted CoA-binding protein